MHARDAYKPNQSAEYCFLHGLCAGLSICLVLEKLGMFFLMKSLTCNVYWDNISQAYLTLNKDV